MYRAGRRRSARSRPPAARTRAAGRSPFAEHLPHLRSREEHAVVRAVRARLRARHRPAHVAEERVLEEQRRDAELLRLELIEDQLRVVGAVVARRRRRGRGRR